MPFVNDKQRKLCWLLYNRDLKKGQTPKWDCHEWEQAGARKRSRSGTRSGTRTRSQSGTRKRSRSGTRKRSHKINKIKKYTLAK